jgi:regulator of protease activity HflC (stomatin/prohibitin superfamily)
MHRVTPLIALGLIAALTLVSGCVVIEDGEVGVSKSFGSISDEPVGPGIALQFPVVRIVETWNTKLQELKETAQVPSSEGLIVGLDSDVVSGYEVKNIYAEEGRKEIAGKIKGFLVENLEERGVRVESVLLRDVKLPTRFRESIEAKLTAEQQVQQKQFMLQQARKGAGIEVARAEGAAKAQEIVRSTLSNSYLQYLWIKTLSENPNVIYVATEANLPIFKQTQ